MACPGEAVGALTAKAAINDEHHGDSFWMKLPDEGRDRHDEEGQIDA